jgi:hypothetical protein
MNCIRLADKSTWAYERGRMELLDFATTGNNVLSPVFRAIDAFEECITAACRALRYADAIRTTGAAPNLQWSLLPTGSPVEDMKKLRNRIHHTDEDILEGAHGQGQAGDPVMLLVTDSALVYGPLRLAYADLASILTDITHFAEALAGYDPAPHPEV